MHLSLSQIRHLSNEELIRFDISELYHLWKESRKQLDESKSTKEWIEGIILLKYHEELEEERARSRKPSGVIHVYDGDHQISSNVSKRTEWNQKQLANLVWKLDVMGFDPKNFVKTKYTVLENNYKSWPQSLRDALSNARKALYGKPSISVKLADRQES